MKPLIGITQGIKEDTERLGTDNVDAITQAGGVPLILSNATTEEDIERIAATLDGLYLTGGPDVDPTYFNQEPIEKLGAVTPARDQFELALTKKMLELKKPILGVCRGCQILNVATDGTIYQDIYSQMDSDLLQHRQHAPKSHAAHFVEVTKNSLLHKLTGEERIKVNTLHHQAVKDTSGNVVVSGVASDGVIEAIEITEYPFALGIQWHPEGLLKSDDAPSTGIYDGFIAVCAK